MEEIASRFAAMNEPLIRPPNNLVISFSHFVPRIDVMPDFISEREPHRISGLGIDFAGAPNQADSFGYSRLRAHSCQSSVDIDGTAYINNAFGYPSETQIAAKRLLCIHET